MDEDTEQKQNSHSDDVAGNDNHLDEEEMIEELIEEEEEEEDEEMGEEEEDGDENLNENVKDVPKQIDLKEEMEPLEEESKDVKPTVESKTGHPSVPVPEQCRACAGTKCLSDIFQLEGTVRVSDIIMKLCPTVRITARDHLPHHICMSCLEKVRVVNEFKSICEATDKELRQVLRRSSNKVRPAGFVIVNCPMSDSENEEEVVDDDEYKVSQSEAESEPVTSDDSFAPASKRKRMPRKRRGRKPGRQPGRTPGRPPAASASIVSAKAAAPAKGIVVKRRPGRPPKNAKETSSLSNVVYIEAPEVNSESDSEEEKPLKVRKRRRRGDNPCPKCEEIFPTQIALKQHMKTHPGFNCPQCPRWFKTQYALENHVERHKNAERKREAKVKKREMRKEQRQQRELERSRELDDKKKNVSVVSTPIATPASSVEKKKKPEPTPASSGRDLFKCVAPLTSTYWSDSFSD